MDGMRDDRRRGYHSILGRGASRTAGKRLPIRLEKGRKNDVSRETKRGVACFRRLTTPQLRMLRVSACAALPKIGPSALIIPMAQYGVSPSITCPYLGRRAARAVGGGGAKLGPRRMTMAGRYRCWTRLCNLA